MTYLGKCRAKCQGIDTLVIHPGVAHMDDLLTTMLLLPLVENLVVVRREPTSEEIESQTTMVADIGRVHDPKRMCFDHHQDRELPASFVLFLQYLGVWEEFKDCYPWAEFISNMDTRGPTTTLRDAGFPSSALDSLQNPLVGYMLSEFAQNEILLPSAESILTKIGYHLYTDMSEWQEAKRVAACTPEIRVTTKDGSCTYSFLYTKTATTPLLDKALVKNGFDRGFAGIISPATRHAGWRFYRVADHPNLDFSRLEGDPRVAFAHKNGFLAETFEPLETEEMIELIQKALI